MSQLEVVLPVKVILFNMDMSEDSKWQRIESPEEIKLALIETGTRKVIVLRPKDSSFDEPYLLVFGPVSPEEYLHRQIFNALSIDGYMVDGGCFAKWCKFFDGGKSIVKGLMFFSMSRDYGIAPLLMIREFRVKLKQLLDIDVEWDKESLEVDIDWDYIRQYYQR